MNNQQAYNTWAGNYDTVVNRTRDVEAHALRTTLGGISFSRVLEIGCGTGKNTEWFAESALEVTCLDFSEEMLQQAKQKINAVQVHFQQADIREPWQVPHSHFDLVSTSLVLEHIEDIHFLFAQAAKALQPGGHFYFGELHPFRQYDGRKARFDTENGVFELECFTHHASDYFAAGLQNGFDCIALNEWFDNDDRTLMPRILSMVFRTK
jgi:ubiquinone/menaquinone biosynthesis C-methylase UbiE